MYWLSVTNYLLRALRLLVAWQKLENSPAELQIFEKPLELTLYKLSVAKQSSWLSWQLLHIELHVCIWVDLRKPAKNRQYFDCLQYAKLFVWSGFIFPSPYWNNRKGAVTGQQRGRSKENLSNISFQRKTQIVKRKYMNKNKITNRISTSPLITDKWNLEVHNFLLIEVDKWPNLAWQMAWKNYKITSIFDIFVISLFCQELIKKAKHLAGNRQTAPDLRKFESTSILAGTYRRAVISLWLPKVQRVGVIY